MTRSKRLLTLGFVSLCATLGQITESQAFIMIGGSGGCSFARGARPISSAVKWPGNTATFVVNTNQNAYGGSISPAVTSAEFLSAVNQAAAAWNGVCRTAIKIVIAGTTAALKAAGDNVNVISWDNRTTGGGNSIANTTTLANATTNWNGSCTLVDCDIVVNGEFGGTLAVTTVNGGSYDLVSTLVHEMGHCLGLDHSDETFTAPLYTSTNALNISSIMNSGIPIGSTAHRTLQPSLDQDVLDYTACIASNGRTDPTHDPCSSYAGTNNGGQIGATFSGGPSSSFAGSLCLSTAQSAVTVQATTQTGGGCVSAAASERGDAGLARPRSFWDTSAWFFEILFPVALYFIFVRLRRAGRFLARMFLFALFASVGLLPWSKEASARGYSTSSSSSDYFFEAGLEYRKITPSSDLTTFAGLDTTNAVWTSSTNVSTFPTHSYDLVMKAGLYKMDILEGLYLGGYLRYLNPQVYEQKGVAGTGDSINKKTTLGGFTVGPFLRQNLLQESSVLLFLELGLGMGRFTLNQLIDDSGSANVLNTSALSIEEFFNLGGTYKVFDWLGLGLALGYSHQKTNAFSASDVSGSLYTSVLKSGDRIVVAGNELKLDRSGPMVEISLVLNF